MSNSRFVTYPSTVEKINHTVVLIDADNKDINELAVFFTSSEQEFDVYVYEGKLHDLEFLNYITKSADHVLISESSQVSIQNLDYQSKFGPNQNMLYPIDYFKIVDKELKIVV